MSNVMVWGVMHQKIRRIAREKWWVFPLDGICPPLLDRVLKRIINPPSGLPPPF